MIYSDSRLRREGLMAILTREDEKVVSHQSQSSSTAESEAEEADGEDSDSFTHG